MKTTLQLLCLGLCLISLSSCDTYVGAGGYAGARPGYNHPGYNHPGYYNRAPAPRPYNSGYNGHYSHNHPSYYSRPAPRPAGVNARVNARGLPLNVNSNTRLGIF